jgi:PAS domain S-box-containing protein
VSILSVFDFFSFLIYAGLGIYVLIKNPDAPLNRVFFGVIACFAVWSFASVFFDNTSTSKETAILCVKIASMGWISFGSLALLFFLVFTENDRILKSRWVYPVLVTVPLIFIYQQYESQALISDLIPQWYGWGLVWKNSVWAFLFFTYYALFTGIGLALGFNYWRRAIDPVLKRQSAIVFFTALPPYILGSLTNVILPELNIYQIPPVANLFLLIWTAGIAYVIVRYRFLTISPATAAENILSTMTEALILLDPAGQIIIVNNATCHMLGCKKNDLEGRMVEAVFASKDDAAPLLQNIVQKEVIKNEEFKFITRDGQHIPVILSATLLNDEWGHVAGIICVARDISERIKMQKRLMALHKLESIKSLAGGIAHEYNNKLSVLSCNIDLLRLKLAENHAVEKNLAPMKTAISQISDLTAQLVAYAREGKYKPSAIDLNKLVTASAAAISHTGNDDIHIEKTLGGNLAEVMADPDQMEMVLHIILSNASEAMQGKGRIQISVNNAEISKDDEVLPAGGRAGHYVRLTVTDDGEGMDEQTLKQIFDPFFSTKILGRGLGMAAVYGVIKNHDGFIDVSSQVGQGTSVSVFLPVKTADDNQ